MKKKSKHRAATTAEVIAAATPADGARGEDGEHQHQRGVGRGELVAEVDQRHPRRPAARGRREPSPSVLPAGLVSPGSARSPGLLYIATATETDASGRVSDRRYSCQGSWQSVDPVAARPLSGRCRPEATTAVAEPAPLDHARRHDHRVDADHVPHRRSRLPRARTGRYRLKNRLLGPPLAHRAARARAARQAHGARGVRVRQPVVVGVRHRGDPPRPRPRGRRRRVRAGRADHGRAAGRARVPDPVVPARRSRRTRRAGGAYIVTARQLRRCCPRRSPASRCSPTTSSPSRCRSPPAPRRSRRRSAARAVRAARSRSSFVVLIAYGNLRGVQRVGSALRGPDLLLHRQHGDAARRRARARCRSATCPSSTLSHAGAGPAGRLAGHRASSWAPRSTSCCTRSRPGGAAVTGVEAISNGVPAFKEPSWKNARITLVDHGGDARRRCSSACRYWPRRCTPAPYESGTPTVITQIGKLVYGTGPLGHVLFYAPPGRHDAHPGARRQHELRRLPAPRELPRRRQLHAAPAHQARAPAGVLERDHLPRRRASIVHAARHRRQGRPPDPALRDRRVHQLHALAGRDGQAPPRPAGTPLAHTGCSSTRIGAVLSFLVDDHHRDHEVHRTAPGSSSCSCPIMVAALRPAEPAVRGGGARSSRRTRRRAAEAPILRRHVGDRAHRPPRRRRAPARSSTPAR